MNTPQKYIDKQDRLFIALEKISRRLKQYSESPGEAHHDWNNWHDLQRRIEDRIADNWSEYKDWHWNTHQFNTY